MDSALEVTDSSDWLNTPVAPLRSVEVALRCQVCKDFYNTPMITTCCHTFCSLCIRRCLTSDGKCPSCRSSDQEIRLRRNWAVQEIVDAFQQARPGIMKLGQDLLEARQHSSLSSQKRKLDDAGIKEQAQESGQRRKTRSQSQRSPPTQSEVRNLEVEDGQDEDFQPTDDLSACPICNARMKVEDVFQHLDTHQEDKEMEEPKKGSSSSGRIDLPSHIPLKPPERLPSLSYSIMNENNLRKRIAVLGIPNWGAKQLLIRRHTEWVNLWNANCDSSKPRSKRDLLHDLDVWERTQGGNAPNAQGSTQGTPSLMAKDFDSRAWSINHESDFRRLVAQARQKIGTNSDVSSPDGQGRVESSNDELAASATVLQRPKESIPQRNHHSTDSTSNRR